MVTAKAAPPSAVRFGGMVVQSAAEGVFEVIQTSGAHSGVAVASVAIEHARIPKLKLKRLRAAKRTVAKSSAPRGERVLLTRAQECELYAQGDAGELEIVMAGACGHRLFHWRAEFALINGEVVVHGPFLAGDPHF